MAGAPRLDRGEIRARLEGFDPAIIAELADAYEQAALAAMEDARAAAKRLGGEPAAKESDDG